MITTKSLVPVFLRPLTRENARAAAEWRWGVRESLRTVPMRSEEWQENWYDSLPPNSQWWDLHTDDNYPPIGMAGLTGIQWENGLAEISLLLSPAVRGEGVGKGAVQAILEEAFGRMRLIQVIGECYECSPALPFWQSLVRELEGGGAVFPKRKWWDGKWWGSYFFWLPSSQLLEEMMNGNAR